MSVQIRKFTSTRAELSDSVKGIFIKLFGIDDLPLSRSDISIEIVGVPTSVVNALRRVACDELKGYALQVPLDGFDMHLSTDPFMLSQFCNHRIHMIPLNYRAKSSDPNLRMSIDAVNNTTDVMSVYAGDMRVDEGRYDGDLFNPTFKIGVLQPGKRLVIHNIHISSGYGMDDSAYMLIKRGAYRHLDIDQYEDSEIRDDNGIASEYSGYKISSMLSNPHHHVLTGSVSAAARNPEINEAKSIYVDSCINIKERLRLLLTTIDKHSESHVDEQINQTDTGLSYRGVQYTLVRLNEGICEGVLQIPGETYTIGELLRRQIFTIDPDVIYVNYSIVKHENKLYFTLRDKKNVTNTFTESIRDLVGIFDLIQKELSSIAVTE